ncbi:MAG: Helix-turn-helix domain [Chloroflexia bacterium]|jgi:antitoxin MazE|nr:Helix-turn-helix domain [Chloroflexia bacterium]
MDILTVEEVAQRLKLNPFTIRRLLREGVLHGMKVGKRQWRVQLRDLEAYLGQAGNNGEHAGQSYSTPTTASMEPALPQARHPYPLELADIEAADLDEMLSRVTPENRHDLVDWGPPTGKEVW